MSLLKALIPGILLTFIIAIVIGSNGSHGGFLDIFHITIEGQKVYWSWPMFIGSTGVSWGIISMMK